jgi:translocation and assembly module TamB
MAYGQILTIERGILNFNGPMDNPGLNIRAMRNSKPVNAGVEITGSATIPIVKLVSDPNVPETDKLAWLVLGHGTEQAGKNDFAILSLAAGALFSQGQSVPLQSQIARAAGLDEFSFAGGDAENASLTLGKRLSSQLYLSYAKSISSLQDVARLTFNITPRWALRAEAGNESAVDVLYTFSFK